MENSISVLIADDHPTFLRGLVGLIEGDGAFKLVYAVQEGRMALEHIKKLKPDVAILDMSMPGMTGLEIVHELRKENLQTEFVILTTYKDEEYFNRAIDLGVKGYILKENTEEELLESLKIVVGGKHYISPTLSEYLLIKVKKMQSLIEENPSLKNLTSTERQILKLISGDQTSKEIAEELYISYRTVENHRTNIAAKLGLKGRNQLFRFAWKNKSAL